MNRAVRCFLLFFVLILIPAFGVSIEGATPSTMRRGHDPIQVPGELLAKLHGTKFDSLVLFAAKNGQLKPIVYQFDERLGDGTWILDLGEDANADQHNFTLDPKDFLIFRIGDTGDRVPKAAWPSPDGIEIELFDPVDGGRSWCYLIEFEGQTPARIEEYTLELVNWDPWKNPEVPIIVKGMSYRIEGLVNVINGRYYKTAINKNIFIPPEAGGTDVNILDNMRVRAYIELLFGEIRVDVDETNIIGGIDALRHGYVRGYSRQWLTTILPLGIPGPRLYSDVFTYDRMVISPMVLNVPINPKSIITRAGLSYGYDLSENAYGMRYYSPKCMDGVTIDGKMSERETAMTDEWASWYVITGPQGSHLFRWTVDESLLEQTKNTLVYTDDRSVSFPPEDVPGSIGFSKNTIELTSVTPGTYHFRVEWYFPPNFYQPGGYDKQMLQDFLNISDAPLIIKAGGRTAKNNSMNPPPLVPKK